MRMINLFLALYVSTLTPKAFADCAAELAAINCSNELLLKSLNEHVNKAAYFTSIKKHSVLQPGQTKNMFIADDDFNIKNHNEVSVLFASFAGTNQVDETVFWLAEINPQSCKIIAAYYMFTRH